MELLYELYVLMFPVFILLTLGYLLEFIGKYLRERKDQ